MLCLDDTATAIAELERAKGLGLSGGLIPTAMPEDARYGDPTHEPFWEAAADLGLPLSLHLGGNRTPFAEDIKAIRPSYFTVVDYWVKESLADLIFAGVLDRHPDLRIGCVEHELGWIPHFLDRLDYTYTQRQGNAAYYRFRARRTAQRRLPASRCSAASKTTTSASASATRSGSTASCGGRTTPTPSRRFHDRARSWASGSPTCPPTSGS